jgi:pseudaminic acid synthase
MKKTYIIAELSANHGHKLENAIETIKCAKQAGADAIKIQTYTPDTITCNSQKEWFKIKQGTIWDGQTLYDLYEKAYTPWEWHKTLQEEAERQGIDFFSTPFDKSAVDFLEQLNVKCYKIASFEITDIPLIDYIASKNKPIMISTGIATIGEIKDAVDACRKRNCNDITLLQCTSSYPADPAKANLSTIQNMRETFSVKVGLSDHTMGSAVSIAAVAMGASVIEKHFIMDRKIGGPDASFSMEPDEFKKMVKDIRIVEKAIGTVHYNTEEEVKDSRIFARSLFVVSDVKKGECFTEKNVRSIRPGYGLSPGFINKVMGKTAKYNLEKGTPLRLDMIDGFEE